MFGNFWYCGLESAGNTTSFLHLPIKSPPWRNIFKCKEPTKMNVVFSLLSLLGLLATSEGFCDGGDLGTEMVVESWNCDTDGRASCLRASTSCSCDGKSIKQGGINVYDSRGKLYIATGGWDCQDKCRGNPGSSDAQAKSSKKSCNGGAAAFGNIGSGPVSSKGKKIIVKTQPYLKSNATIVEVRHSTHSKPTPTLTTTTTQKLARRMKVGTATH